MRILILYATTDGQTGKVARFVADLLSGQGHRVEVLKAADVQALDLEGIDRIIAAGSVHVGGFQSELVTAIKPKAAQIAALPNLFLSVSLSAAGDNAEDWAGLNDCLTAFSQQSGWTPADVVHVAGAFKFTQYDFFRSWAMRWIASKRDQDVDPKKDKEYTDWPALGAAVNAWMEKND